MLIQANKSGSNSVTASLLKISYVDNSTYYWSWCDNGVGTVITHNYNTTQTGLLDNDYVKFDVAYNSSINGSTCTFTIKKPCTIYESVSETTSVHKSGDIVTIDLVSAYAVNGGYAPIIFEFYD